MSGIDQKAIAEVIGQTIRERDEARSELAQIRATLRAASKDEVDTHLRLTEARAEVRQLTQALHDVRAILGFDNDGDATPAASIAGAGSIEKWIEWMLRDVREHRVDDEALPDELQLQERGKQ